MKGRVTGTADMNHGRHFQLYHFFVNWVPVPVTQGRGVKFAARGIRVQVAADEAEFIDAAVQFSDAVGEIHAGALGQGTGPNKIVWVKLGDAVNQFIGVFGPVLAGPFVANVRPHPGGAGRKDSSVSASFALQF